MGTNVEISASGMAAASSPFIRRAPIFGVAGLAAMATAMIAAPSFSSEPAMDEVAAEQRAPAYLGRLLDAPAASTEATVAPAPPNAGIARFRGRLNEGLAAALHGGGVPSDVAHRFIATIAERSQGLDIGPDDHFDLVVDLGSGSGPMLVYAALDRIGASDVQLVREGNRWLDAGAGDEKRTARPVPGRMTSRFGMRRHPLLGYSRMHQGVDFAAAYGSPVVAATSGRVVGAGWAGGYGRQVRIAHSEGLASSYSHLSRFAVSPGHSVRAGQVIGYAGSSGLSTGPHVHYEVTRNGVRVDPLGARLTGQAMLDPATQARLAARISTLLRIAPQPRG